MDSNGFREDGGLMEAEGTGERNSSRKKGKPAKYSSRGKNTSGDAYSGLTYDQWRKDTILKGRVLVPNKAVRDSKFRNKNVFINNFSGCTRTIAITHNVPLEPSADLDDWTNYRLLKKFEIGSGANTWFTIENEFSISISYFKYEKRQEQMPVHVESIKVAELRHKAIIIEPDRISAENNFKPPIVTDLGADSRVKGIMFDNQFDAKLFVLVEIFFGKEGPPLFTIPLPPEKEVFVEYQELFCVWSIASPGEEPEGPGTMVSASATIGKPSHVCVPRDTGVVMLLDTEGSFSPVLEAIKLSPTKVLDERFNIRPL